MARLEALDVRPLPSQKLYLAEALGRVLAEDIVAHEDSPAYPTAAMDGYAIIGADQAKGRVTVLGDNAAGTDVSNLEVIPGSAIKTFTGSLMPRGADTLIPIENVTVEGDAIRIDEAVETGFSVRPVGENYRKGEVLIPKGTTVSFAEIGVMASLNVVSVRVAQKPRVAILATGSEILEVGQCSDNPSQIRSSNSYTLEALVRLHGGEAVQLGSVHDDKAAITRAMREALAGADIVVTTGGVSVGDYDFVKEVVREELECEVLFKGVLIKPGQHIMVARKANRFVVSLPGFAYSSTVTFILYVLPLLYRMQGRRYELPVVNARLVDGYRKKTRNKSEFAACNLRLAEGEYRCDFSGKREGSSAILTNLLGETGLLWLEPGEEAKEPGDTVRVVKLG
ncbi:molybdopterin molybdotransferase MoeA [Hydrogenimonas sp.]